MTVTLYLGEDSNGHYGAMPLECYLRDDNELFFSFWGGNGNIHHDVFEHYFEFNHKYFHGDYGMNVLGEIVATGHMVYYVSELQCGMRTAMNGTYLTEKSFVDSTLNLIRENCDQDWTLYGDSLISNIPDQKPDSPWIEDVIELYLQELSKIHVHPDAKHYYKSCTPQKIRNALRYGSRMARKLCPDTNFNNRIMDDFIIYWKEFCEKYNAESVSHYYDRMKFDVYTKKKVLHWDCHFRSKYDGNWIDHREDLNIIE